MQDLAEVALVFGEVDRIEQARDHDEDEHDPYEDEVRIVTSTTPC